MHAAAVAAAEAFADAAPPHAPMEISVGGVKIRLSAQTEPQSMCAQQQSSVT